MRNLFLIATLLFTLIEAQAQRPVLRVEQYRMIIDRSVKHNSAYNCYKWASCCSGSVTCYYGGPLNCNSIHSGKCLAIDPSCGCGPLGSSENFRTVLYRTNGTTLLSMVNPYQIPQGSTITLSDTIELFQPQFEVYKVSNTLTQRDVAKPDLLYTQCVSDPNSCQSRDNAPTEFFPSGNFYDSTKNESSVRYMISTRVRIIPNLDPTFTLPSHDKIYIKQTALLAPGDSPGHWEYYDFRQGIWVTISSSYVSDGGNTLYIDGVDLFGANYKDYLNLTIPIRLKTTLGDSSDIRDFTHRLSSPHITSVTPTNLNCFERNEGSLKIKFDRRFIPGERLNILLTDTVNRVNYSALNIDSLAADSSYTWRNELRAGLYSIRLLGKYADSVLYDMYVPNRVDTIPSYIALNSVNFEDGFETPATDNFISYTDFSAYSQATYTGSIFHFAFQQLTQPSKLRFVARVDSNVLCKGASTGVITIAAGGGMLFPGYKKYYKYSLKHQDSASFTPFISFTNTTPGIVFYTAPYFYADTAVQQKITGLKAGTYQLRLRDSVNCYAKDSIGNEVTYTFTITEPARGITADQFELHPITSSDSANAWINLVVSGGTPRPTSGELPQDEAYIVQMIDSATGYHYIDNLHYSDTTINDTLHFQTAHLDSGTYIIRVYDANYNLLTGNTTGCYLELIIPIRKPQPLLVDLLATQPITCYAERNGKLVARATGGIWNDSTRYKFTWYELAGGLPNGTPILLPGSDTAIHITDSLINGLYPGLFKVVIEDKYGNQKTDTFRLIQPTPMNLTFEILQQPSCYSSMNGIVKATASGGTLFSNPAKPYRYEWSNGDLSAIADSLAGGQYFVVVRDSMNCVAMDTVELTSPFRVIATHSVSPVTCYNSTDGSISVSATGGTGAYTYVWSNGNTTAIADSLPPGRYWYTVYDSMGCFDTDTITLEQPDTLSLTVGVDQKICVGQTVRLTADVTTSGFTLPVMSYLWSGPAGFSATSQTINVTQNGTYQVMTTSSGGCVLRDTVVLTRVDSVIHTDFLVSSQVFANENTILVNVSTPMPDSTVEWLIPSLGSTVTLLNSNRNLCEVRFAVPGIYTVGMKAYYRSGCIDVIYKNVNVLTPQPFSNLGNQADAFLKKFKIYPNPNDGNFTVELEFNATTQAKLRLVNLLTNQTVDTKAVSGQMTYTIPYNLSGVLLPSQTYVMVIETPKGNFVHKVVKQ